MGDSDTVDSLDTMDSDTMVVSDTTARGLLMLSLRPRPMLIPTSYTVVLDTPDTMVLDTLDTMDTVDSDTTVSVDTTAGGLLMLRLRLILTTPTDMDTDWDTLDTISDTPDTSDTDTSDTAVSTATESKLYNHLSANHQLELGQKWIVISLNFPSPVLQFQCYHTKSLVMVSRK